MTFIEICRELDPAYTDLKADQDSYRELTKKLKDIFAALGIIQWLGKLKTKDGYNFPDKSKPLILFLLKEYAGSLKNLRNESKIDDIADKDIIFIYKNIDILFEGCVNSIELNNIKLILTNRFNIPERHSTYLIDTCQKQVEETINIINHQLIPVDARTLLRDYYTKELCTLVTKICKKWRDISDICYEDYSEDINEDEVNSLSRDFTYLHAIYSSIVDEYFCPEDPDFPLADKLKNINGLESIQKEICYLLSKQSKTGTKNKDNNELMKLRKQKKELIQQQIEKDLMATQLDFSEVINFYNMFPDSKKTPREFVHGAIDYYLQND